MISIKKEFTFDAAHRLMNHEGKCNNIHGHTYRLIIKISTDRVNDKGMIIDFGDLKEIVKKTVLDNYDHFIILNKNDKEVITACQKIHKSKKKFIRFRILDFDPTAEVMAENIYYLLSKYFNPKFPPRIKLSVTLYETPTSSATYEQDEWI